MNIFEETAKFVNDAFQGRHIKHFERTVFWFGNFYPGFTEAHRVAAYSHDIERAHRKKDDDVKDSYLNPRFLKTHQEGGAKIMTEFLTKLGVDKEMIEKVAHLISK